MSQSFRITYIDLRPRYKGEWESAFQKRYGKKNRTMVFSRIEDAEKMADHFKRCGLADVEIVPVLK